MAIRFNCDCGQTISAREEFAGRKVQCVGCKKVHVVPGQKATSSAAPTHSPAPNPPEPSPRAVEPTLEPQTAPPPAFEEMAPQLAMPAEEEMFGRTSAPAPRTPAAAAPSNMLHFRCACGSEYQAKPEYAGEPTRCPRCGEVLFVPARTSGAPVLAAFDREDRYHPIPDGMSFGKKLLLALLVLGILGGGAYAAYAFHFKDVVERYREQDKDQNATIEDLVPPNALGFTFSRIGLALDQPEGMELLAKVPRDQMEQVRLIEEAAGMKLTDIESVLAVIPEADLTSAWVAVSSREDFDRGLILRALKTNTRRVSREDDPKQPRRAYFAPDIPERMVTRGGVGMRGGGPPMGGGSIRPRQGGGMPPMRGGIPPPPIAGPPPVEPPGPAVHFVNNRLLVIHATTKGMLSFLKSRGEQAPGPLEPAVQEVRAQRGVVAAVQVNSLLKLFAGKLSNDPELANLFSMKTLVLSSDIKLQSPLIVRAEFSGEQQAENMRGVLQGFVTLAQLGVWGGKALMPAGAYPIVRKLSEGVTVEREQATVRLKIDSLDNVTSFELLKALGLTSSANVPQP